MPIKYLARFSANRPMLAEVTVVREWPGQLLVCNPRILLGTWRRLPAIVHKKTRRVFDTKAEAVEWLVSEMTAQFEAEVRKVRDV